MCPCIKIFLQNSYHQCLPKGVQAFHEDETDLKGHHMQYLQGLFVKTTCDLTISKNHIAQKILTKSIWNLYAKGNKLLNHLSQRCCFSKIKINLINKKSLVKNLPSKFGNFANTYSIKWKAMLLKKWAFNSIHQSCRFTCV